MACEDDDADSFPPRAQIFYPDEFREYEWIQYREKHRDAYRAQKKKLKQRLGPHPFHCPSPPPPSYELVMHLIENEYMKYPEVMAAWSDFLPNSVYRTQRAQTLLLWFSHYLRMKYALADEGVDAETYMRQDTFREGVLIADLALNSVFRGQLASVGSSDFEDFIRERIATRDQLYRKRLAEEEMQSSPGTRS